MPRPKRDDSFATRRVRGKRRLPTEERGYCLCLWMGLPVSGLPLPKLEIRTGRAVVDVEGRWVVVGEYFPAFVGLGTNVHGWSYERFRYLVEAGRAEGSWCRSKCRYRAMSETTPHGDKKKP